MTAVIVHGKEIMEHAKCGQIDKLITEHAPWFRQNTGGKVLLWSKLHDINSFVYKVVISSLAAKYPQSKDAWQGTWAAICKRDNKGKKQFTGTAFLNEVWSDIWTPEEMLKLLGAFKACPQAGTFKAYPQVP